MTYAVERSALGQTQNCIVVKPVNLFGLPWDRHKVVSWLNLLICSSRSNMPLESKACPGTETELYRG
jgi:hypothetical protein